MLKELLGEEWAIALENEFKSEYMKKLSAWLTHIRISQVIYPEKEDVFRALRLTPLSKVKVVIIGKEPYYQGNADGLAFSFKRGERKGIGMQALDVILKEIENDCYDGFNVNRDYELDYLAKQGVLLLNARLTVRRNDKDSHKNCGWESLTSAILRAVLESPGPKVYMIWGNEAKSLFTMAIREEKFLLTNSKVLTAYHPAYDLHNRDVIGNIVVKYPDGFTGCKHFSQANKFLLDHNMMAIDWLPVVEQVDYVPILSNQSPF